MATLNLNIHKVVCVDEIGNWLMEKAGNDEIYLGGVILDNPNVHKISSFEIYAHFDDGDVKDYDPPRVFYSSDLSQKTVIPDTISATFVLADKQVDGLGGHNQAITRVYDAMNLSADFGAAINTLESIAFNAIDWSALTDKVFKPRAVATFVDANHLLNGANQTDIFFSQI
jgi:hypothetical protein